MLTIQDINKKIYLWEGFTMWRPHFPNQDCFYDVLNLGRSRGLCGDAPRYSGHIITNSVRSSNLTRMWVKVPETRILLDLCVNFSIFYKYINLIKLDFFFVTACITEAKKKNNSYWSILQRCVGEEHKCSCCVQHSCWVYMKYWSFVLSWIMKVKYVAKVCLGTSQ